MPPPELQPNDPVTTGILYRRIYPDHASFQNGQATSAAFNLKKGDLGISAHLAALTSPEEVLAQAPDANFGLAEISVEDVIRLGFSVKFDPRQGEPGHVIICGNFSKPNCRRLSRASRTIKEPTIP